MRLYNYTAKDKTGDLQKGEVEAENENAAAKILTSRNLYPISVAPLTESAGLFNIGGISSKDKAFIVRQLATMVAAGLPIAQSIRTLEKQAPKKNVQKILAQLSSDIEEGTTLSNAMARFPKIFSKIDVTLIASGETSGNLDKALLQMANQLEKNVSMVRKIRGALVYPAFVLIVALGVMAYVVIFIVPQMKQLYDSFGKDIPSYTKLLIAISDFAGKFWYIILFFMLGFVTITRYLINTKPGRLFWDNLKIKIIGLNKLLKELYMARFSRTLSGLVTSGVPLLDSLVITSDSIGNVVYRAEILAITELVKGGTNLSDATKKSELFPPVVNEMITVGEKTGELDNMLEKLADYFEEEVDEAIKNISNLILPVFIIVLGGLVAFIVLGTMMPIYNFASQVK